MKITREELQAIENHMSNIPMIGGMYAPVLIGWCRALLDEIDRADAAKREAYLRGAEAMREMCIEIANKRASLTVETPTDRAWCISARCIEEEIRSTLVEEES